MKRAVWLAGVGLTLGFCLAAAPAPEVSAPDLAQRLGCWACHARQGEGGKKAASLDRIGARLTSRDLEGVLSRPRSRHPGAKMPSYAYLRPQEMQALVDYLAARK